MELTSEQPPILLDSQQDQRPLNLRQIEIFRAIMLSGSICSAGKMLHVSQPAVSRMLALAESRLGYLLFERTKRRLVPTPEARRLYAEIEDVYNRMRRINSLAANLAHDSVSTLKIATNSSVEQVLLPLALTSLQSQIRNLRTQTRTFKSAEMLHHLLSGNVDLSLSLQPIEHPSLITLPIGEDRVVCVMPKQSSLAQKTSITPDDFIAHPWISYPGDVPMGQVLRRFLDMDPAGHWIVEADTPVSASSYAKNGLGSALVNASCLPPEIRSRVTVRPLSTDLHVSLWVSYSNLTPPSLACQKLINTIGCLSRDLMRQGSRTDRAVATKIE